MGAWRGQNRSDFAGKRAKEYNQGPRFAGNIVIANEKATTSLRHAARAMGR
jgi:hypothetical protein